MFLFVARNWLSDSNSCLHLPHKPLHYARFYLVELFQMSQIITGLFDNLWRDYISITPSAKRIHALLESDAKSESDLVNDHIALRTFNLPKVGLNKLAAHFLSLGYKQGGEYHFEDKKLYAQHFEHPDPSIAKVFISELLVEQLSEEAQLIIARMVDAIDATKVIDSSFLYSGAHWPLSQKDYQTLINESEYAAWMSVWGPITSP